MKWKNHFEQAIDRADPISIKNDQIDEYDLMNIFEWHLNRAMKIIFYVATYIRDILQDFYTKMIDHVKVTW